MFLRVEIVEGDWDPNDDVGAFVRSVSDAGGISTFVGKVRPGGGVEALELSHYPPLTLPGMKALAETVSQRWSLEGVLILHRVGVMYPGEPIVCVSAAARHRREAIEAVDFAMDHLKSDAWFWKREKRADGWHWIEPRAQDHSDLARWR